ncbi:Cytochrome b562 [Spongiibacter sp. IMCC21906]|uniref:cytochrome b562 n=1 Tax=Spongiibacter sp. IMCC21906 TaxID=1620392 RepID=UPI00062DFA81|nr:cytochrome b562 [Spongiibacter sp. IMCC21906]AKH68407.1 Cytochrome b562 [Spongiibacter sp. IMCC21906]
MKKYSLVASLVAALMLSACGESELHSAMEGMGGSYKAMKEAKSLAPIKEELEVFKSNFEVARQQQLPPEDQSTFDEGMEKIDGLVTKLDAAVKLGDLVKAQALLAELREVNKEYHKKLEVKKH